MSNYARQPGSVTLLQEIVWLVIAFFCCEIGFNVVAWSIYYAGSGMHSEFAFIIELNSYLRVPFLFLCFYVPWVALRRILFPEWARAVWIANTLVGFTGGCFLGWISTEISL